MHIFERNCTSWTESFPIILSLGRFERLYKYNDRHAMASRKCRGLCFIISLVFICLGLWAFDAVIGAIHFSKWYPRFDLTDVHIRSFNVTTSAQELNFDMDILITGWHFSGIRAIEYHTYDVQTFRSDLLLGETVVPRFHPHNGSLHLSTTQKAQGLSLGVSLGSGVQNDLNTTGKVALRIVIRAKATTALFFLMKSKRTRTCELIVNPSAPFGSQIVDRLCCLDFPCLQEETQCTACSCSSSTGLGPGSAGSGSGSCGTCCDQVCVQSSTSCCNLDRRNPLSTRAVCDQGWWFWNSWFISVDNFSSWICRKRDHKSQIQAHLCTWWPGLDGLLAEQRMQIRDWDLVSTIIQPVWTCETERSWTVRASTDSLL